MSSIAENLARVEEQIAAACRAAGRARDEVALMAVSKTHPVEYLLDAAAAGHRLFGENRVQELSNKASEFADRGYTVELAGETASGMNALQVHLIGHLQSNKAARAAEIFTAIDTIDSAKLAERLEESCTRLSRKLPILIEIKLSDEPSKEGLAPESRELDELLERLQDLVHLVPRGLMTVAPFDDDPEVARACFRRLRLLRETFTRRYPQLALNELSMGMSGDFAAAIEEGSTLVRIGTAIFGTRPKPV